MENMFNTDSGLRPPSPLPFPSAPGHGLFGESLGFEDFRFQNQDFLNMPNSTSSAGLGSSSTPSTSLPPPPLPPGIPPNSMMNMMIPPGFGQTAPSMQLFNPSEQRFFSEFLDTLVVDQDFTFDPSAIPNLPNLPLFTTDPMPITVPSMDTTVNNSNHNYMIPSTSTSSTSISAGLTSSTVGSVSPQRHSVGTSMDFDITGVYNNNNSNNNNNSSGSARTSESQHPITVPAKRTKTNKASSSSTSTDPAISSPARKGTPSNGETGNKITTPMSKLSLNNQNGINSSNNNNTINNPSSSSTTPTKSKKNKREQEDDDEKREDVAHSPPGNAHRHPTHRISGSSAASASSRSQSQSTIKHERNNSLSDEYASDNTPSHGMNGSSNGNGQDHSTNTSSGAAGATPKRKPYKELLTEEEKRANHIASEQKRRNTIRNGFKDMTEIIPDLKDVNSSKSTILFKAVDFIKYLEKRNKNLQEKASQLEQRLHIQKGSQQHQMMQQQQSYGMHHMQHQQHQNQHHHQQHHHQQHQQHHHHHHQIFHNPGLDDKRFQEIPSVYPVAISR